MNSWSHQLWTNPRWDSLHHTRLLEVGVRVVGQPTSSRRPYLGTVISISHNTAEVFFDSGNWSRQLPLRNLAPVVSWFGYNLPNPPVPPLRRPLATELRESLSIEYDVRALECGWLFINNRVFYGRLTPPQFAWLSATRNLGFYNPNENTMAINRLLHPTVKSLVCTLASLICEQAVATLGSPTPAVEVLQQLVHTRTGLWPRMLKSPEPETLVLVGAK